MQTRVHASRTPTILYVGVPDASLVHERKFSGIRRYASMREWEVVAKPMPEEGLGGIPELIRRLKPLGCIVECASRRNFIPKRLAGPIPVIYLDSQPDSRSGNLHCVSIDR